MMERSRRSFLKISGACLLGMLGKPAMDALAVDREPRYVPGADTPATTRWAMVVDTRKCEAGCTDCIDACHRVHNVPEFENPKEEIKWIWQESYEHVFPGRDHEFIKLGLSESPIAVLCNHCDNPPCVRVCPVQATWKREDGIVMMDYHRCIGCRCCMAACPYGSRSFNWGDPRPHIKEISPGFPTRAQGVAEKCNFCAERLDRDLEPACVEACKCKGLIFGNLEDPDSKLRDVISMEFTVQRRPELGTKPRIFYIL